ncbi:L-aspartate oxidase [Anaerotignum neopropionicum]|uniref:L-aspartate oxidase n=1 Tax=Anaerotignum neopropionicum TaxID=36847 RepID=A0A136WE46_9FIRM|nr:L-aspartate oxidase [Anaerotignum neopropionicum]KXL52780.1 L-aspartate oxidase [Anaerotignum neopropionicum]
MKKEADVVIVGTGVAGLFCALNIPANYKIIIITKKHPEDSDSLLAQGGISVLRDPQDYEAYFEDTLKAGRYKNNKKSVEVLIRSSRSIIEDLVELGVNFDSAGADFSYTREGAHSVNRILHHKDVTGKEITEKLLEEVKKKPNITILPFVTMIDIMEENSTCTGVVLKDGDAIYNITSRAVVWATGGIGGLFEHSTNMKHITGDAIAIAIKHNVKLLDMNYVQIHPTTLYSKEKGRSFLISEAVRGEGALLLNKQGQRFVDELLPRDVVSEAIFEQMKKDDSDYVYLSLRHIPKGKIKERFPNIYEKCLEEGYDLATDLLPVTPAQHYFMGGVQINIDGETSMKNLFAVGETSCNGVHGANRLASNSLLEALVFSKRAAHVIGESLKNIELSDTEMIVKNYQYNTEKLEQEYHKLVWNELNKGSVEYGSLCKHEGSF